MNDATAVLNAETAQEEEKVAAPCPLPFKPIDLVQLEKEGVPPVQWLAEPYLVEGEIHLLIGDGATGKTFLTLDTALGLAAGRPIFVDCSPVRSCRVLFIDEDGSEAQVSRRLCALAKGRGIPLDGEIADRLVVYSGRASYRAFSCR